ncbi:hypothetical protein [Laspinema olomoucense]|uniref:Uncharacterized protein n=1 Tax=Laspinema olomoucense D3b TaxID=2953688 RepID=A0ABT2N1Q6_9CYAN|nr:MULTISPECIES: hypothetical protein [unclassified Laspinema]MCT7976615.1 hypothetical protein [Laspinema sp. D3b]MCT7990137.1 hypothetical protein [Laspinema sp. D3a]MCT7996757.1 hypothetical protein [Laspinema sp. D3c]
MTLKHLPEIIMMVALAIPLSFTPAAHSHSVKISPDNCPKENHQNLALSSGVGADSGGFDRGQGMQPTLSSAVSVTCSGGSSLELKLQTTDQGLGGGKQSKDACFISGRIYGIEGQNSRGIYVVVIDPNTDNALARFPAYPNSPNQPNYEFSLMRPGRYLLSVFQDRAGTLVPFRTRPSERLINCSGGSDLEETDFELP